MNVGTPLKRAKLADRYDTVVIGSGIGGLATASMLARHAGERVLVLERHYTAGGFTHAFRRPGFDWDVGVHYVGEVNRRDSGLRKLFDHLSDGALDWADMGPVYDRIRLGDDTFDFVKGASALRDKLVDAFPAEAAGIDAYLAEVRDVGRTTGAFFGERLLPGPLSRAFGPFLQKPALRHIRRTTADVVHGLVRDPALRGLLTAQWGDYGLPPRQSSFFIHGMVVGHYLNGAAYPVGGAGRIAETILPSIEQAGGAVVVRAEVARIVIERGRAVGVELASGRRIEAGTVVSDAGATLTYGHLLPEDHRPVPGAPRGIGGIAPSVAHLSLYVGLRGDPASLGLPRHNVWVYPGADHDANFARLLDDDDAPLPAAFLSFAAARDPDFARRHPGHATAEVVTFAPTRWFERWLGSQWGKRGDDYEATKAKLAARLREVLLRELPQLRDAIVHEELSTPLTTAHFAAHPTGEIYGLAHTPARFEARFLRPATPVPGLFLAGADVASAGVAGGLMGGLLCAAAVLGREPWSLVRTLARGSRPRGVRSPATRF